jgi:tRNA(Leu) C34 or U34 (ribose-2'-O)-methylase TrmL
LWFFLKKAKSLKRKNENYKSNTITYPSTNNPATYSIQNAPNKVFNTQAKQSYKLSSGYYPEGLNEYFEQLLLSEYVWLKLESSTVRIPVKVKTSSMNFKTSVNDRLIEYTINFEEAFDYINNIR